MASAPPVTLREVDPVPVAEVVEVLEDMLRRAEAGEIIASLHLGTVRLQERLLAEGAAADW